MDQHRAATGSQVKQWPRVGAAGRPAKHEVDGLGLALKQGDCDLTRRERLPDVPDQEIDDRCATERPCHFLTKGGQPADE